MRTIPLTQGQHAIVDDEDYDRLTAIGSWHFDRYAKRSNRGVVTYMHRVVLGVTEGLVDHSNGNKLDNRKANLRPATSQDNNRNRRSKDGYKGVSWDRFRHKWKACISVDRKQIQIGRFDTSEEAALAYNEYAKRLFGNFAVLNHLGGDEGVKVKS